MESTFEVYLAARSKCVKLLTFFDICFYIFSNVLRLIQNAHGLVPGSFCTRFEMI